MKKVLSLVIVCVMLMSVFSVPVFADAEDPDTYTDKTVLSHYTMDPQTEYPDGTITPASRPTTLSVERGDIEYADLSDSENPAERHFGWVVSHVEASKKHTTFYYPSSVEDYVFHYEADHKVGDLPITNKVVDLIRWRTSELWPVLIYPDGSLKFFGEDVLTVESNCWYHISLDIDLTDCVGNITITDLDGNVYTVTDVELPSAFTFTPGAEDGMNYYISEYSLADRVNGRRTYQLDNLMLLFKVRNYRTTFLHDDEEIGGDESPAVAYNEGEKIVVAFDRSMDTSTIVNEKFVLTNDVYGNEVDITVGDYDADSKSVEITFNEELNPKSSYTLSLSGLKTFAGGKENSEAETTVSFTTANRPFSIKEEPSVSGTSHTVKIENSTGTEQNGYIVAVTYAADGNVQAVASKRVSGSTDGVEYTIPLSSNGVMTKYILIDNDFQIMDIWGE